MKILFDCTSSRYNLFIVDMLIIKDNNVIIQNIELTKDKTIP